jgi:hypothetical protein
MLGLHRGDSAEAPTIRAEIDPYPQLHRSGKAGGDLRFIAGSARSSPPRAARGMLGDV